MQNTHPSRQDTNKASSQEIEISGWPSDRNLIKIQASFGRQPDSIITRRHSGEVLHEMGLTIQLFVCRLKCWVQTTFNLQKPCKRTSSLQLTLSSGVWDGIREAIKEVAVHYRQTQPIPNKFSATAAILPINGKISS